jgi:carbon-monoxide dehydrogenase small subunit
MNKKVKIELTINGSVVEGLVGRKTTLVDFLREDLHLTGTKKGCGTGDCGSCVVLIDGEARASCNMPAHRADGCEIVTIEGIAEGRVLSPLQEVFVESGAIQCGFCTPGMVIEATAFLERNPAPSEEEIREAISGHICRCTGYVKIVEAISMASKKTAAGE